MVPARTLCYPSKCLKGSLEVGAATAVSETAGESGRRCGYKRVSRRERPSNVSKMVEAPAANGGDGSEAMTTTPHLLLLLAKI